MDNLVSKCWLGVFSGNWADEMSVNGFRLFTHGDKKDFEDSFKKVKHEINFSIGTNESIEFINGKDLLSSIDWKEISPEEYIFMNRIFGEEFGFFPDSCVIDEEDEE